MSNAASGLAHLKPFLPGLEPLLARIMHEI